MKKETAFNIFLGLLTIAALAEAYALLAILKAGGA